MNRQISKAGLRSIGALILMGGLAVAGLIHTGTATGETPPPPPTNRHISIFPVMRPGPAQYEVFQTILDFPPGAMTREHTHGGPEFVTVVEGQLTLIKGGVARVFTAGQSFREEAGSYFTVANATNAKARAFASILLVPGQQITINHGDRPIPSLVPTTVASSRVTVTSQPAEFDLQQRIIDFGPGSYAGPHRHTGPVVITQLSGEIVSKIGGVEVKQQAGGTYVEVAGVEADHRNSGQETATVAVTLLVPKGAAPAVAVSQPGATTAGAITPPNTGDGGLR